MIREYIPLFIAVVLFVVVPVVFITSSHPWRIAGPQAGDVMFHGEVTEADIEYFISHGELPADCEGTAVVVTPAP